MTSGKYIRTEQHKKKLRNRFKGKDNNNYGKKRSKEANKKAVKTRMKRGSYVLSKETKRKISEHNSRGFLGKHHSKEIKLKLSKLQKGKKLSEETKRKMRQSAFEYVKKTRDILYPCIGHNEKKILDKLERELNCKITRQYKCEGYFIDGYIEEINIAIEVDERPKIKEKDIEREKIIKDKLNCKFVRIKDYD